MIDTDVDPNSPADRELTTRLYYSDLERRLQQEMILGIGGVRALRALGYQPAVLHMNEGHSAFLAVWNASANLSKRVIRLSRRWKAHRHAPSSPRTRRCRPGTTCSRPG